MSEFNIITEEKNLKSSSLIALNLRLFRQLDLFKKILPLTIMSIAAASIGPSIVRWYAGRLADHSSVYRVNGLFSFDVYFNLSIFVGIGLTVIFFRIAAWTLFEVGGMWGTDKIHSQMMDGLSRTRTTFFDENPSGRILNRLNKDFDQVRSEAIIFMGDIFNAVIEILSIVVVTFMASPATVLLAIPLMISFFKIQKIRSQKIQLARSEMSISYSHVLHRQTDLIEGRSVFLRYGKKDFLNHRLNQSFIEFARKSISSAGIEALSSFGIRFIVEVFSFGVLIFIVINKNQLSPALVGVIISCLFSLSGAMNWLDFAVSLVTGALPSLSRVFEYVDLPREEDEERPTQITVKSLSQLEPKNEILSQTPLLEFKNLFVSYRKDLPLIIKNLSLQIFEGEKVALIGRTGAGKSSFMQALLRMVYVQSGDVLLRGESIYQYDLKSYRKAFSFVPQFPYLFEGTIRSNLDPEHKMSDSILMKTIRECGCNFQLEDFVQEGGKNLSLGERQLLCLARVMAIRLTEGKKIILMDEPTSGLDPISDAKVTHLLSTAFKDCTVITIAHRLESVTLADRIFEFKSEGVFEVQKENF